MVLDRADEIHCQLVSLAFYFNFEQDVLSGGLLQGVDRHVLDLLCGVGLVHALWVELETVNLFDQANQLFNVHSLRTNLARVERPDHLQEFCVLLQAVCLNLVDHIRWSGCLLNSCWLSLRRRLLLSETILRLLEVILDGALVWRSLVDHSDSC